MNTDTENKVFGNDMSHQSNKPEPRSTFRRDASVALMVAMVGFVPPAFAYLDPSTGGMIISAILGLLATIGLALKTYWYKVKNLFGGSKVNATTVETDQDKPEA
jgi:hypothetical protein